MPEDEHVTGNPLLLTWGTILLEILLYEYCEKNQPNQALVQLPFIISWALLYA